MTARRLLCECGRPTDKKQGCPRCISMTNWQWSAYAHRRDRIAHALTLDPHLSNEVLEERFGPVGHTLLAEARKIATDRQKKWNRTGKRRTA